MWSLKVILWSLKIINDHNMVVVIGPIVKSIFPVVILVTTGWCVVVNHEAKMTTFLVSTTTFVLVNNFTVVEKSSLMDTSYY